MELTPLVPGSRIEVHEANKTRLRSRGSGDGTYSKRDPTGRPLSRQPRSAGGSRGRAGGLTGSGSRGVTGIEREGLVLSEPSSGTIVAPLDAKLIRDLYGFREGVERQTAEILARRTDVIVGPIEEVLIDGRDAVRSDDFSVSVAIDLDLRFHTALYDAVGNRILSDVMRGQWINMRRVMAATLPPSTATRTKFGTSTRLSSPPSWRTTTSAQVRSQRRIRRLPASGSPRGTARRKRRKLRRRSGQQCDGPLVQTAVHLAGADRRSPATLQFPTPKIRELGIWELEFGS